MTWAAAIQTILTLLLGGVGGGIIGQMIRSRAPLRKIEADREANLLEERAAEMASMRDELKEMRIELKLAAEELRIARHETANAQTALELFLTKIEADPDNAREHATRVRAEMERDREKIDKEKELVREARIAAIGKMGKP